MTVMTAIFRLAFVVPVARLMLRAMAWRLLFVRMAPFQVSRNEALASSAKAAGHCAACGASGALQADHHRPIWAGGLDVSRNVEPLCLACHRVKTNTEATVRATLRRVRHREGHGHLRADAVPAHRWALAGLLVLGLVDGAFGVLPMTWRVGVVVVLAVGVRWQLRRRFRLADLADTLTQDGGRTYRPSLRRDHLAVSRRLRVEGARTRAVLIWLPSAYLVGLVLAFLAL